MSWECWFRLVIVPKVKTQPRLQVKQTDGIKIQWSKCFFCRNWKDERWQCSASFSIIIDAFIYLFILFNVNESSFRCLSFIVFSFFLFCSAHVRFHWTRKNERERERNARQRRRKSFFFFSFFSRWEKENDWTRLSIRMIVRRADDNWLIKPFRGHDYC